MLVMTTPRWLDTKISIGNVVSWVMILMGIVTAFTLIRADVTMLKEFRDEARQEMREYDKQQRTLENHIIEIRTDLKFIRQQIERRP